MGRKKADVVRPYAPDYCSRETLAYRLDCSPDKVEADVDNLLLPPPEVVGTLKRWHWDTVVAWIKARNGGDGEYVIDRNGQVHRRHDVDPFVAGIDRVTASNAQN
jgi:hypothetical protein